MSELRGGLRARLVVQLSIPVGVADELLPRVDSLGVPPVNGVPGRLNRRPAKFQSGLFD